MLDTFEPVIPSRPQRKKILKELIERGKISTSYREEGVALPHARVNMKRPYALAVGRCPAGLDFEGKNSYEDIRFVFLLLASEKAKIIFRLPCPIIPYSSVMDHWMARDRNEFKNAVRKAFIGTDDRPARRRTKFNKLLTDEASEIAKAAECSTILVFTDAFSLLPDSTDDLPQLQSGTCWRRGFRTKTGNIIERMLHWQSVPSPAHAFLNYGQLFFWGSPGTSLASRTESAVSAGFLEVVNLIPCLLSTRTKNSNPLSDKETKCSPPTLRRKHWKASPPLPPTWRLGREGKSIGAMFVLGDHEKVLKRSKQLVLNPLLGYGEEDRSVLNPFMDETIKELALIDGAFIVRGNGVVESAGCLIQSR